MEETEKIIQLLREQPILRPNELAAQGLSRSALYVLYRQGRVIRSSRGLYSLPETNFTEHHSLAEVCKRVPHGVICLLSALRFHNIGTQTPFQVWLAIDRKARHPHIDYPPLRIARFSGAALNEGVDNYQIEGVPVRIYSVAKTVADCFKYRHKVGVDVALEALRDALQTKQCSHQELWHYAKVCRVSNIIQPYLEAMT